MIKKCLLAAAVTAAAMLCLTGCQPKEDPLQLGSTAVVLETDEAQNGLNGTEADLSLQAEAVPEVTAGPPPWKNQTIKALPGRSRRFSRSVISKRCPGFAPIPFTLRQKPTRRDRMLRTPQH